MIVVAVNGFRGMYGSIRDELKRVAINNCNMSIRQIAIHMDIEFNTIKARHSFWSLMRRIKEEVSDELNTNGRCYSMDTLVGAINTPEVRNLEVSEQFCDEVCKLPILIKYY